MSNPSEPKPALIGQIIGALVIAVLTVAFAISFAAIVYSGPLSAALSQGIAHTLIGGAAITLGGAWIYSFRGMVCHPQDVTAVLLGGVGGAIGAQALTSGANGPATIGTFVVLASLGGAAAAYAASVLRLGGIVRYIPHPVIGGFLGATGYILAISGLGMAAKTHVDLLSLPAMFTAELLPRWAPWVVAGFVIALLARRVTSDLFLPGALAVLFAGFYLALAILGISLEQASQMGLLLGPFDGAGFLAALNPAMVTQADWGLIAAQSPTLLAIALLVVIGAMMNASGIEMALNRDFDTARDLRGAAASNLAAGLVGGLPGYVAIGETLLSQKLALAGRLPSIAAAIGCVFALVFGADLLGALPIGVFAALVVFLGFDLIIEWLWEARHKFSRADFAVVLIITIAAALIGFLPALGLGLVLAVVLFLVSYGRVRVIRARTTLAARHSRVERPLWAQKYLAEHGGNTVIYELEGYLFFGTANRIRMAMKEELSNSPETLILDFARVVGMDVSAVQALAKVAQDVEGADVPLILSGLTDTTAGQLRDLCPKSVLPGIVSTLDLALEGTEAQMLAGADIQHPSPAFKALITALAPRAALSGPVQKLSCAAEMTLIERGTTGTEMFLLLSGVVRAEIPGPDGAPLRVAQFQPGAILGELAHYAGVARTADIRTEAKAELLRVDLVQLGETDPGLAGQVHELTAQILAQRVVSMTTLLRNAGL